MPRHDYVAHTLDCLDEAVTALALASDYGQISAEERREGERLIAEALRGIRRRAGRPGPTPRPEWSSYGR